MITQAAGRSSPDIGSYAKTGSFAKADLGGGVPGAGGNV